MRINLVETRLKSAGYQLNPLSSVLLTAPVATVLLCFVGLATDREITWKMIQELFRLILLPLFYSVFIYNTYLFIGFAWCLAFISWCLPGVPLFSWMSYSLLVLPTASQRTSES